MRILFCSPNPLTKEQGAAKVLVELAEEMRVQGWTCDFIGPEDVFTGEEPQETLRTGYMDGLKKFLQQNSQNYDVIDYDHALLPFARDLFSPNTLMVARSVLLVHHFEKIPLPFKAITWKSRVGRVLKARKKRLMLQNSVDLANKTLRAADLINVANNEDKVELTERGFSPEKVVVIPYGISEKRRPLFDAVSSQSPSKPRVAFVGTFDVRKGAKEFPLIVERISQAIPDVEFRLLGTGSGHSAEWVSQQFPLPLRSSVKVTPFFDSLELPSLLADCSVGVFPSHIEGFGFGVLEMMAAALPVIAYNAPGPPMMLSADYLVPRGNVKAMSDKVISLLRDPVRLQKERQLAQSKSQEFTWRGIAKTTSDAYKLAIAQKKA